MLGKSTLRSVGRIINFGRLLAFHPFRYLPQDNQIVYSESSALHAHIYFNCLLLLLYEIFLCYRCAETMAGELIWQGNRLTIRYMTGIFLMFNYNHVIVIGSFLEMKNLINSSLYMAAGYTRLGQVRVKKDNFGKIVKLLTYACALPCVGRSLGVLRQPGGPIYLTSLARDASGVAVWAKVLCAVVHLNVFTFHYYMMIFHAMIALLHVFAMVKLIGEVGDASLAGEAVGGWKMYTRLRVLQKHWNAKYCFWIFLAQVGPMVVVMVRLFEAIVHDNFRSLVLALLFLGILLPAFKKFSEVHEASSKVLHSWKTHVVHTLLNTHSNALWSRLRKHNWAQGESAIAPPVVPPPRFKRASAHTSWLWLRKFGRASSPINVEVGSFFFVDPSFVLSMVTFIVVNTTNLVLTYRETRAN